MFELYQTKTGARGSLAEVWIDQRAGLVMKLYKPNGTTITGGPPHYRDMDTIRRMFENEISWSTRLRSKHVLEIYEHGELKDGPGFYLLQEYVGPDLLHYYRKDTRLLEAIPDASDQMIELFKFFRHHGVYKINNAMSNMTISDGQIKAYDFKYAVSRTPETRDKEIHSINTWISKIDPTLTEVLLEYV